MWTIPATGGNPRQVFAPRADLHAEMPDWYVENGQQRLVFSGYTP
jgi:hypothetical protein